MHCSRVAADGEETPELPEQLLLWVSNAARCGGVEHGPDPVQLWDQRCEEREEVGDEACVCGVCAAAGVAWLDVERSHSSPHGEEELGGASQVRLQGRVWQAHGSDGVDTCRQRTDCRAHLLKHAYLGCTGQRHG